MFKSCLQTCNIFVKIQIQSKLLIFCSLFEIIFWSEFLGTYISGGTCGGWGGGGEEERWRQCCDSLISEEATWPGQCLLPLTSGTSIDIQRLPSYHFV